MTTLPPPGEPDIYEALIEAMIIASTAHLEADVYFRDGLKHLKHAIELYRQMAAVEGEMHAAADEAEALLSEGVALLDADPKGNLAQARAKFAEMREVHRRGRSMSAGASALMREASAEITKGLEIRDEGTHALRIGLERATTILQEVRRHQTNGDTPDATAA